MASWLSSTDFSSSQCIHARADSPRLHCRAPMFGRVAQAQHLHSRAITIARADAAQRRHRAHHIRSRQTFSSVRVSASHGSHVAPEQEEGHLSSGDQASDRRAVLRAAKRASRPIKDSGRPLAQYMTLPASQYSVLDAKKIDRIDEQTFRCYVDSIHFLGLVIEPILTVSVTVGERGPTVKLLDTRLEGSPSIQSANDRFEATMTNVVSWTTSDADDSKDICSDTSIEVTLQVPAWMKFIPKGALEKLGSQAMQGVLNTMVPRFLTQLQKDYQRWAAGDESRKPVGTGQL